jgi:hypothetical protein
VRTIAITTFIMLLAANVFAQQPQTTEKANEQFRRGTVKLWIGVGLAAVGASSLALPEKTQSHSHDRLAVPAAAMMISGVTLIAWGARDRSKAVNPQTTIGVMVGPKRAIQIRRSW